MLPSPPPLCGVGGVGGAVVYVGCLTPACPPVVWYWVLGLTPPPLPPCNVVWCGGGLWVSGLVFNPFPPPCGVVVGVGFRVCTPAPPVVWVGFRCIDMQGFSVEGQQLGAAQTETVARPGECRRIGHATKLHSLKRHNTHEDPRFGAHPCDCWHFWVGGEYRQATRDHF